MNDESAASERPVGVSVLAKPEPTSLKRKPISAQLETPSSPQPKPPKKPRDTRLHDCFEIKAVDGGFNSIVCRYCMDYNKVLLKFNPTKARKHLTEDCSGTDEALKRELLSSMQAARKCPLGVDAASDGAGRAALVPSDAAASKSAKKKRLKDHNRNCPVHLTFHTDVDALGLVSSKYVICVLLLFIRQIDDVWVCALDRQNAFMRKTAGCPRSHRTRSLELPSDFPRKRAQAQLRRREQYYGSGMVHRRFHEYEARRFMDGIHVVLYDGWGANRTALPLVVISRSA